MKTIRATSPRKKKPTINSIDMKLSVETRTTNVTAINTLTMANKYVTLIEGLKHFTQQTGDIMATLQKRDIWRSIGINKESESALSVSRSGSLWPSSLVVVVVLLLTTYTKRNYPNRDIIEKANVYPKMREVAGLFALAMMKARKGNLRRTTVKVLSSTATLPGMLWFRSDGALKRQGSHTAKLPSNAQNAIHMR